MTEKRKSPISRHRTSDILRLSKKLCAILASSGDVLSCPQEKAMTEAFEKIAACRPAGPEEACIQLILAAQAMELIEEGLANAPERLAGPSKSLVRAALGLFMPMAAADLEASGLYRLMPAVDPDGAAGDGPTGGLGSPRDTASEKSTGRQE